MSKKDMTDKNVVEQIHEEIKSTGDLSVQKSIAERAMEILNDEYGATISNWESVHIVARAAMLATMEYLKEIASPEENAMINMHGLCIMGVTYRPSEDGEKEGNFTPYFEPTPKMKTFFKSDDDTEEND